MLTCVLVAAPSNQADVGLFADATTAAILAAVVSFLGLIISKESKISEFRQNWIDALREDAATLITHMRFVHGSKILDEANVNLSESYIQLNQVKTRIRLRLNPNEEESKAIIAAMDKMSNVGHDPSQILNAAEFQEQFVVAVQTVLQKEWKRVKRGELIYQSAFWFSIVAIIGFIYLATAHYFHRTIFLKPF